MSYRHTARHGIMTSTKCLFQNDFNHPSTVFLPGWPVSCGQVSVNATHPEEQLRPSDILLLLLYQTRPPRESRLPGRDGLRGRQTRCICRCASRDRSLGEPSTWSCFTGRERAVYSQLSDPGRVCRWQWDSAPHWLSCARSDPLDNGVNMPLRLVPQLSQLQRT